MNNNFDDIAAKLSSAGMDEESINASMDALREEFADLSEEEIKNKIAAEGGEDGITDSILNKYETAKKN
ncbi:MAG: hypothetical protein IKX77_04125 [Clostridia bacterium]|nr:hypothetical protein [Clostridia bacterium]